MALSMISPKRPTTIHVTNDVRFGIGEPHLGQVFALLLTSCPHSLHLVSAIVLPLPCDENDGLGGVLGKDRGTCSVDQVTASLTSGIFQTGHGTLLQNDSRLGAWSLALSYRIAW